MIPIAIGPRTGKFTDVVADPLGWALVYQDEADGHLRLVQLHPDGSRRVPDVPIAANGGNAFPRLRVSNAATWLAFRDGATNHGVLMNLTAGTHVDLGEVHGNNPIALGDDFLAYQSDGAYRISGRVLGSQTVLPSTSIGRPTGLAWFSRNGMNTTLRLIDDVRLIEPGMVNPWYAGGAVVGENASGQNRNIARVTVDGREATLWPGLDSFTPHIAFDGQRWAVVTWGGPGVRLMLLEDADFALPTTPDPPPPVLPDTTFIVNPHGVIEHFDRWLFSRNQGPDVHISPDEMVRCFIKSDEVSGDGPGAHIAEHWDRDGTYIGHLDDASAGQRILDGKAVTAEQIVAMGKQALWPTLPLNHNFFDAGARAWATCRLVSGTVLRYTTNIRWTTGYVQPNIPVEIVIDVGAGIIHGKRVEARIAYRTFDGHRWNAEVNYYAEPDGFNAWVAGPYPDNEPRWLP